jgi:hypothetical protein
MLERESVAEQDGPEFYRLEWAIDRLIDGARIGDIMTALCWHLGSVIANEPAGGQATVRADIVQLIDAATLSQLKRRSDARPVAAH